MKLYYYPISTYSQKVLLALYEKEIDFEPVIVEMFDEQARAAYNEIYPIGKIPLLCPTEDHLVPESNIIIEYLEGHFDQGTQLIPDGIDEARKVRFMDRMNDLYLNDSMATLWFADSKSPEDIAKAKHYLDTCYEHLNARFENSTWVNGEEFTMADCSCIPPLFYLQKVYPFNDYPHLVAYFERAMSRPSYQRVLSDAMPILETMQA